MSERDVAGLLFTAEMYGVQLDQLAVRLAVSEVRARAIAARWREQGYADSARLGPGLPAELAPHHPGGGRLTHPGQVDGYAKDPGDRPFDMRAQRRGRGMDLQHAMN